MYESLVYQCYGYNAKPVYAASFKKTLLDLLVYRYIARSLRWGARGAGGRAVDAKLDAWEVQGARANFARRLGGCSVVVGFDRRHVAYNGTL